VTDRAREGLISAHWAARILGMDERTLYRWIAKGRVAGEYIPPENAASREKGPKGTRGRWLLSRAAFVRLRKLAGR